MGEGTRSDIAFWRGFGSKIEAENTANVEWDMPTIKFRGTSDFVQPYNVFA